MKRKEFFLFLIVFTTLDTFTFSQTGFFILIDKQKNCLNLVRTLDSNEKYCVAPKPIIGESEINLASEIGYNLTKTEKYFKLKLSDKGFSDLQLLVSNFSSQWVLVIDGRVVGSFKGGETSFSRIIIVSAKADSKEIDSVFVELKKRKIR